MKKNKKTLSIVERAKKTLVGRIVCRVMGEETGAVMMEYVIVATLIAAAVAVAVWFFGADIAHALGFAGRATLGDDTGAQTMRQAAKTADKKQRTEAIKAEKAYIETSGESTIDSVK